MTLFINACVRAGSRTMRLAKEALAGAAQPVTEVRPIDLDFPKVDEAFLEKRDRLIAAGRFDDPLFALSRQFSEADEIVVAAPYWDLSFPAALKQYFEQINVVGISFRYTPEGVPVGLCRAKKLTYITTAGGEEVPEEYGFGYVRALATGLWGIEKVARIRATGLDVVGADVEEILRAVEDTVQ